MCRRDDAPLVGVLLSSLNRDLGVGNEINVQRQGSVRGAGCG